MVAPYVTPVLSFSGISYIKGAVVTKSNGVRPGIALVNAVTTGTNNPDTSGTATFTFGTSTNSMVWRNALCDLGTTIRTTGGFIDRFVILDRRWRWRRGTPVTGAYNVRNPDNTVITATQKTVAQLATILFTAFGEASADVSLVTTTELPFVVWDRDNPADELAELLESRGYVISLVADDTVKVYPKGTGATLPVTDDVQTIALTIDPPEVPNKLTVYGNRTYCQSMLKLVPVGLDNTGAWKKVQDLSYSPGIGTTGWDGCDLVTFNYITDADDRDLAMQYVGRTFQVVSQADGTQNLNFGGVDYIPGEISVSDITQLLPINEHLLESYTDPFGTKRYEDSFVSGTFWGQPQGNPQVIGNTDPFTRVDKRSWKFLSKDLGIIQFEAPAVKDSAGKKVFADVYLTCSYSVNPSGTQMVKDRYSRDKNLGGYGIETFKVDELQRTLIAAYTSGTSTLSGLTDNKSTINAEADLFLNAAALQYVTQVGNVVTYRDCYNFSTDGINLQVQWTIMDSGKIPFSTMASQYMEALPFIPTTQDKADRRKIRRQENRTNNRNKKWKRGMFGIRAVGSP